MMMNGTKTKKILFQIYVFKYIDLTQRSFEFILLQKKNLAENATSLRVSIILRVVLHLFMHLIYYLRGAGRIFFQASQGFFSFTAIYRAKPSKQKILCCRIMVNPGLFRLSYSSVLYPVSNYYQSSSEFVASKFYRVSHSNFALMRIQILIFYDILGPMCSWNRAIYATFISFYRK